MNLEFYRPPAHLRDYIRYFWTFDDTAPGALQKELAVFADRFPRLIVQHLDSGVAIKRACGGVLPDAFIGGVVTKLGRYSMGNQKHIGVSFSPFGLKAFFCIETRELIDDQVPLSEFCRVQLVEKLSLAKSKENRFDILIQFFTDRLSAISAVDRFMENVFSESYQPAEHTVYQIAKNLKISERQTERRFKSMVGISPQKYIKILRFERALEKLKASDYGRLSDIAYDLNYCDQCHFIKEFKEMSGYTPRQFIRLSYAVDQGAAHLLDS